MAEYSYTPEQIVEVGQNVILLDTIPCSRGYVIHRNESGIFTLRGIVNSCSCFARYKVSFGANISIPEGGTVEPISLAIAIDGEPVLSSRAIVTPAAVDEYDNIYVSIFVTVAKGCCNTIAVENTSTQDIQVQNANLIIERVA